MTDDEVHSALNRWLKGVTGLTTIKAHGGGPSPEPPYVMANLTGTAQVRQWAQDIETADVSGDVKASIVLETEWRFSVHAYGPNPTGILRPVRSAVQLAQKLEPMFPALVIHDVSQVRNVPDWINEAWEPRGQMDISVRGLTRDGFVVDVIEEAPISITGA